MAEQHAVELAEVELGSEAILRLLAELEDLELADFVGTGLPGSDDVTLDLRHHVRFRHAGVLEHVLDGLLARPSLVVDTGVDNEPHGAEELAGQIAESIVRAIREAVFRGKALGVKRPALPRAR